MTTELMQRLFRSLISLVSSILLSAILTGCMVGPNFHAMPSPHPTSYTDKPLPIHTAATASLGQSGISQHYKIGQDISSEWWRVFHSQEINHLIDQGIAHNQNLTAAYASLRQAQEKLNAQIGNLLLPAASAALGAQRERFSSASSAADGFGGVITNAPASIFNIFNATVNVSYTLDFFGGNRRQIEALRAQVDYQQFELIAAYLTLTTNIVTTTVTMASLQAQIESTKALIRSQRKQLNIFKEQYRLGGISLENVSGQEASLGQTLELLPPLEKSLAQNHNVLAVLIGALPNTPLAFPKLNAIHLPADLPVSVPSRIIRQRPDVRASEALLHAASAQIGVATAALLPQFNLTGSYGWEGIFASSLLSPKNLAWDMASQLTQPLFRGGYLIATRRAAVAAYELALAQYRQTVLQGFQNVSDSLKALETDARTLKATRYAELAAKRYYDLTSRQYLAGGTTILAIIVAEQEYRQASITRIQAQAARYTDTAALFQALGGGWWNKGWCVQEAMGEKECA